MCSILAVKIRTIPTRIAPEKAKFANLYVEKKADFF
jgi:hypothetical protein